MPDPIRYAVPSGTSENEPDPRVKTRCGSYINGHMQAPPPSLSSKKPGSTMCTARFASVTRGGRPFRSDVYRQWSSQRLQRPPARCGRSVVPHTMQASYCCARSFTRSRLLGSLTGLWMELPWGTTRRPLMTSGKPLCGVASASKGLSPYLRTRCSSADGQLPTMLVSTVEPRNDSIGQMVVVSDATTDGDIRANRAASSQRPSGNQ